MLEVRRIRDAAEEVDKEKSCRLKKMQKCLFKILDTKKRFRQRNKINSFIFLHVYLSAMQKNGLKELKLGDTEGN